jgi:sugar fermentation stimulation protein A
MKFEKPLLEGILLKRYKRFLADVRLESTGQVVLVHVPNSGSMLGVKDPGSRCRVSVSDNLKRKIPYTLEQVQTREGIWVGVNTSLTNKLVAEAFESKLVDDWAPYSEITREVKVGTKSRLDFLLSDGKRQCFVEVKNVSMAQPPCAVFPDAVTERGQKHLDELLKLSRDGHGAELFFVVQREDCETFKPCDEIDPVYGKLLREVAAQGVKIHCWACEVTPTEIRITHKLPVDLR